MITLAFAAGAALVFAFLLVKAIRLAVRIMFEGLRT